MDLSENQFMARMKGGNRHETEPFEPRGLTPAQEGLLTFYEWLQDMPIDEAELAIKGIQAYNDDLQRDRDIELGWHRNIAEA